MYIVSHHYVFPNVYFLLQKLILPALFKPNTKIKGNNLLLVLHQLQKALPPVLQEVVVPVPLQVRGLRSHHLGVAVASAHSSAL